MQGFFKETTFWAKYDREITQVPKSLLIIPLLTNLLPLAWACGVDVLVQELDRKFLKSSDSVRQILQKLYPAYTFSGKLYTRAIVKNNSYSHKKKASLFSGGVDSITTFIRKKKEKPLLVTVWGSDIKLEHVDAWKKVQTEIRTFGKKNALLNAFITSNFRSFLDYSNINKHFSISWWGHIQHGYALLGLCAPLSYTEGLDTIYIPSSYSKELPWGSTPKLDNQVKWGQTSAVHDGFELTKHNKLEVISKYIKKVNPALQLRVCYKSVHGDNCGKCLKCTRTMIGLLMEGLTPNRHGFPINSELYENTRSNFLKGKWKLSEGEFNTWLNIQKNLANKRKNFPSEGQDFIDWLEKVDIKKFKI